MAVNVRINWEELAGNIVAVDIWRATETAHGPTDPGVKILQFSDSSPEWVTREAYDVGLVGPEVFYYRVEVTDIWGNSSMGYPVTVDGISAPVVPNMTATPYV